MDNEILNAGIDHNMNGEELIDVTHQIPEELDPFRKKHLQKEETNHPIFESETDKLKEYLLPYCNGDGIDIGCGGSKIKDSAIAIDLPEDKRYANVGNYPIQLHGDARDLLWFRNNTLDYCYSSHLLEDFPNTVEVMKEWTRVIKVDGHLVLNLPHEMKYREHCEQTGQTWNAAHTIEEMSPEYMKSCAKCIPGLEFIFETPILHEYVFGIVFRKGEVQ